MCVVTENRRSDQVSFGTSTRETSGTESSTWLGAIDGVAGDVAAGKDKVGVAMKFEVLGLVNEMSRC